MKLTAAILLAMLAASGAHATETLDQSFTASGEVSGGFSDSAGDFRRAQVVTAGVAGFLDRIDVQTDATGFSDFDILAVANGLPTQTVLGHAAFVSAADGAATFSSSVYVTQGEQFAIEPVGGDGMWDGQFGGYAGGGSAYLNTSVGTNAFTATPYDFGFKTFVNTSPLTLDQSFTASGEVSGGFSDAGGDFRRAQVVTAGANGTLARIDVQTDATGGFSSFDILAVANGLPTTTVLGTADFVAAVNGMATFSASLNVTAGEQFAIEPVGGDGMWDGQFGGYAGGGSAYVNTSVGTNAFTATPYDFGFRTFLLPADASSPTPEPATWAAMIAGFGLVGAAGRRRRAIASAA